MWNLRGEERTVFFFAIKKQRPRKNGEKEGKTADAAKCEKGGRRIGKKKGMIVGPEKKEEEEEVTSETNSLHHFSSFPQTFFLIGYPSPVPPSLPQKGKRGKRKKRLEGKGADCPPLPPSFLFFPD